MFFKLLLTVILATAPAFAQRGGGGGGRGGVGGGTSGMPMSLTNRLEIISEVLQLDKNQKKYVKTTFDEAQKEAAPVREQLVKSHEGIGDAIQAGKSAEEVTSLITGHTALEARMTQIELKAFAKVFLQLNQTQQGNSRLLFQMMRGMFSEKNWNSIQ